MKKLIKITSMFLAVIIIISAIPMTALAYYDRAIYGFDTYNWGNYVELSWDYDEDVDVSIELYKATNGDYELLKSFEYDEDDWDYDADYKDWHIEPGKTYKYKLHVVEWVEVLKNDPNDSEDYDDWDDDDDWDDLDDEDDWEYVVSDEYDLYKTIKLSLGTTKLKATKNNPTKVTLSWKTVKGAKGYYVYNNDKLIKTINNKNTTTTKIKTKPDTTYKFRVAAFTKDWNGNKVTGKLSSTKKIKTTTPKVKLKEPNLKAKKDSITQTTLSWGKINNAIGYYIYNNDKLIKTINNKNTTTTKIKIKPDTAYKFRVAAFAKDWYGNKVTGKLSNTKKIITTVPKVKVNSSVLTENSIKLSWKKVEGITGYKIYRNGKLYKTITNPNTTFLEDEGLTTGKYYTYKICSYLKYGKKVYLSNITQTSIKPTKNEFHTNPSKSFSDLDYGEVYLRDKSVVYNKDGKIEYTALALNNRMFHAIRFNWIRITIRANGKTIASQKFKNVPINLDGYDYRYMTFTFDEGTKVKNANLRSGYVYSEYQYNYQYSYN